MPPARGLMFALFIADGASCSDGELSSPGGSACRRSDFRISMRISFECVTSVLLVCVKFTVLSVKEEGSVETFGSSTTTLRTSPVLSFMKAKSERRVKASRNKNVCVFPFLQSKPVGTR
jgi:hypothetical protein